MHNVVRLWVVCNWSHQRLQTNETYCNNHPTACAKMVSTASITRISLTRFHSIRYVTELKLSRKPQPLLESSSWSADLQLQQHGSPSKSYQEQSRAYAHVHTCPRKKYVQNSLGHWGFSSGLSASSYHKFGLLSSRMWATLATESYTGADERDL